MKKINSFLLLMVLCLTVAAQDNDTLVLRKNNIVEVKKYQFVHAFEDNKDTCLLSVLKYDTNYNITYLTDNRGCMGQNLYKESSFVYGSDSLLDSMSNSLNGKLHSWAKYYYADSFAKPTTIETYIYATQSKIEVKNSYFASKRNRIDSTNIVTLWGDGTQIKTKSFARYNANGDLVQAYTTDSAKTPLQMLSNEIDKKGWTKSSAYTTYGEHPTFMQTYYEYDETGRLLETMNTVNQKQEYYYYKNGLLKNILAYNPKGVLELEYIFAYTKKQ